MSRALPVDADTGLPAARTSPWIPIAFLLVGTLGYGLTFQEWLWGDGAQLLENYVNTPPGALPRWGHPLYFIAVFLVDVVTGELPVEAFRWTSALGGGLLLGGLSWLLLMAGFRAMVAVLGTLLLGLSPLVWFQATSVEVHALHGGCVALGVAAVYWSLDRRKVVRRAVGLAAGFLVAGTHLTGVLLLPGWAFLFWRANAREERRLASTAVDTSILGIGMGAAYGLVQYLSGGAEAGSDILQTASMAMDDAGGTVWSLFLQEWICRLGFTLIALLPIAFRSRPPRPLLVVALVFAVPSILFFSVLSIATSGGYYMGTAPFIGVLAAIGIERAGPRVARLAVMLILANSLIGYRALHVPLAEHRSVLSEQRIALAQEALPEGGLWVSADSTLQTVSGRAAGVSEVNINQSLVQMASTGASHAEFNQFILGHLDRMVPENPGRVAFDRGWRELSECSPRLAEYLESLELALSARYGIRSIQVGPTEAWALSMKE